MKIYLYGILGVYNYGCEAMIRAISEQLKSIYPDCRVIYKTYNLENDRKALADCTTVELEAAEKKFVGKSIKNIFFRGIRYLKKKLNVAKDDDYISIRTDWARDCDLLVIIGGDIFDLIPSVKPKKYHNERIHLSRIVKENGGKVLLWGISVGSFESDLSAKKTLMDYFKDTVELAVIRDRKSYNYLKDNGVERVELCTDPACMLRTVQCPQTSEKNVLGINLSPLSNRYLNANMTEAEWINKWSSLVERIYRELHFDSIMLIPHVVVPDYPRDDDYAYLKCIYDVLTSKSVDVELAPPDLGFLGIKEYIIKCNLVLSARMHCAINSITCGVPTIFLSYSPKSVGMCQHVYGNGDMFFDMNEMINELDMEKLGKIAERIPEIKEYLRDKNYELQQDALKAVEFFKEYLLKA